MARKNYFFAGFAGVGAGAGTGAGAGGTVMDGVDTTGLGASAFFSQPTSAIPADSTRTVIRTKYFFMDVHLLSLVFC
jgi:hypothetical protein